ncbi:MAG: hypothetical protein LBS72_08045 [Oscillospiraceae bacterium]|jgi:hypothetical protein|nr:hypothetical protein [Oscillospiraceae bacterium]
MQKILGRSLAVWLVIALILCSGMVSASAASETWKVNTSAGIYVRSSANSSSSYIGALAYGSIITVTSKTTAGGYTWGYVSSSSAAGGSWGSTKGGWVALNYCVKTTSAVSASPSTATYSIRKSTAVSYPAVNVTVNTSVPVQSVRLTVILSGQVYNGTGGTQLSSSNGGKTWTLNNMAKPANTSYHFCFAFVKDGVATPARPVSYSYSQPTISGSFRFINTNLWK